MSQGNGNHGSLDEGPMQLIRISQDLKTFELNQEALSILRSIEGDIGVVAVSGAQRTGKSFILNLLLDKQGSKGVSILFYLRFCSSKLVLPLRVAPKVYGYGESQFMLRTEICMSYCQILKEVDLYKRIKTMMPRYLLWWFY